MKMSMLVLATALTIPCVAQAQPLSIPFCRENWKVCQWHPYFLPQTYQCFRGKGLPVGADCECPTGRVERVYDRIHRDVVVDVKEIMYPPGRVICVVPRLLAPR